MERAVKQDETGLAFYVRTYTQSSLFYCTNHLGMLGINCNKCEL